MRGPGEWDRRRCTPFHDPLHPRSGPAPGPGAPSSVRHPRGHWSARRYVDHDTPRAEPRLRRREAELVRDVDARVGVPALARARLDLLPLGRGRPGAVVAPLAVDGAQLVRGL